MKIFIIGIAGGVGGLVARQLLKLGNEVDGLVRKLKKKEELSKYGIEATVGDLVKMSLEELAATMKGCDAIVFTAGAGDADSREATTQVDGEGPPKVAAAAKLAGIDRLVLVSVFPEAWRERHMPEEFEHYMIEKKRAETKLVVSDLDWVIVRPSALTDDAGRGTVALGLAQIHVDIAREDVAATVVELLMTPSINRIILEVTNGPTPIHDAVTAMRPS
jgi:uncharacterized protein YbjT (DUF2867 family)